MADATKPLPALLLAEDSLATKAVLVRHLGDYRVFEATNGEDAWQLLMRVPEIEIVITDLQMPVSSGHQLLARIRKSTETRIRDLPVIVLTAADDKTDRDLAFLNGANDFVRKPVDEFELQARVRVHHRLAQSIRALEESRRQLAEQATTDPLTGLKNRRAFFARAEELLALARRHHADVSVLVLDIDHFKKLNDSYGHDAGDQALRKASDVLKRMVRAEDIVARIGGEEFALLLPGTNRLGAAVLAERIRVAIENEPLSFSDPTIMVTASIGVSSMRGDNAEGITGLLRIADQRLYLAKQAGRNRICVNDQGKSSFA